MASTGKETAAGSCPKSTLVGHMASTGKETAAGGCPKSTLVAEGYGQRDVHEAWSFTQGLADIQLP